METSQSLSGFTVISVALVLAIASAVLIVWFHSRREYPPIKARFWWQSEFISASVILWTLQRNIVIGFPGFGGKVFFYLSYPLFFTMTLSVSIRLAHIYSAYKVAEIFTEWKSSNSSMDIEAKILKGGFFVKHARRIQKSSSQAKLIFIHWLIQTLFWSVAALSTEESFEQKDPPAATVITAMFGVTILGLAAKTIPLKDGLYLRQEIVSTFCAAIGSAVTLTVLRLTVDDVQIVQFCEAASRPLVFVPILIGFPLYKSYVWQNEARKFEPMRAYIASFESSISQTGFASSDFERQPRVTGRPSKKKIEAMEYAQVGRNGSSNIVKLTLKQVLAHPEGVEAFKEFCKQELNHESILFFLDAKAFCEACKHSELSPEEITARAIHLYQKFVRPGAFLEINIDDGLRQKFVAAGLEDASESDTTKINFELLEDTFREARDEVFKLMATDAFVRFLRHRLYREFFVKAKEKSVLKARKHIADKV